MLSHMCLPITPVDVLFSSFFYMNPLPLRKNIFSWSLSTKQSSFHTLGTCFIVSIFCVLMTQPHRFEVAQAKDKIAEQEEIQEVYQELLAAAQQENSNGDIQFETLIVGEDGETKITYTINP